MDSVCRITYECHNCNKHFDIVWYLIKPQPARRIARCEHCDAIQICEFMPLSTAGIVSTNFQEGGGDR